jgi:hypothetical protein
MPGCRWWLHIDKNIIHSVILPDKCGKRRKIYNLFILFNRVSRSGRHAGIQTLHRPKVSWTGIVTESSVAGPGFWGLINPQWPLCTKGRRQSPINVEADKLLYDPYLRPLHLDKHKVRISAHLLPPQLHKC